MVGSGHVSSSHTNKTGLSQVSELFIYEIVIGNNELVLTLRMKNGFMEIMERPLYFNV